MKLTASICSMQVTACNLFSGTILRYLLGYFLLTAALPAAGQVKNYSFTASDGAALTALTAPVALIGPGVDDGSSSLTAIPFSFEWNGVAYTQFSVSSNGLVRLGSNVTTSSNNSLTSVTGVLSPFWDDLQTNTQGPAAGVQYQVIGTAPNRVLVIQWTAYNYSSASNVQFQCTLSETTNSIAFTYGAGTGGSASIGMIYSNTDFKSVSVSSGTASSSTANNNAIFPAAGKRYVFTVPPACSGIPAAGATISSLAAVCANTAFSLSLQNQSPEKNISYQWQFSADGVSYTDIAGATAISLTRSQAEARWYRCQLTCTNSNQAATSAPVQVTMKPGSDCYCKPPENNYCDYHITHVSTSGGITNFSNNTTCAGVYSDYRSVKSASQYPGYPVTMSFSSNGNNYGYSVWIDFNDNGTYEPVEKMITQNVPGTVITATFTVPASAAGGTYNMRVRGDLYYNSWYGYYTPSPPYDPCNALQYGETEDYSFTVISPADCKGTPAPGNTVSSVPGPVCAGNNFMLSLQNSPVEKGLTYQWQSSADGINYTAISGATAARYPASQNTPTWYRCLVSCSNSGQSAISTPIQMNMNTVEQCYCIPAKSNYNSGYYIANVSTTGGISNFSNESRQAALSYEYFKSQVVSQYQGGNVQLSLTSNEDSRLAYSVWIDFNDDGLFSASERVVAVNNSNTASLAASFTVPLSAAAGKHRMRVRGEYSGYGAPSDACNTLAYGETEDYVINILPLAACSAAPNPGNTLTSGANPVCPGNSFTLSLQNDVPGAGIGFQWQSSQDGTTYTDIAGANSASYTTSQTTATYYRCVVSCSASGLSATSAPLSVTLQPGINCYCIPEPAPGPCINYINLVATSGGVSNFSNASYCDPNTYSNFSLSFSASQYQGRPVTISFGSFNNDYNYSVWIDFNDNGMFETGERVIQNARNSLPGSFTVPANAPAGTHRMRVRGYSSAPADACVSPGQGETEDYGFTVIVPPPACTGTPVPGNTLTSGSIPVCAGAGFKLFLQNKFFLSGISYQWQSSADGVTYTDIAGATDSIHNASQTAATWYRCRVSCTTSGLSAVSSPLQISISAPVNCYCIPDGTTTSYVITNVTATGGIASFNNASGTSGSNYSNYTTIAASQYRGGTINFEFSSRVQSDFGVWIDFNDDGIFDAAEQMVLIENAASTTNVPASFVVPASAPAGTHRMRIRSQVSWNAGISACGSADGETEDYSFTVLAPPACTGTPAPGNTMSMGANPICAGTSFTLFLQNNMNATGLGFQWQSSTDGLTYTNIAGANAATFTTSQTATTWYRCLVTCTNSGLSRNSTALQVTANAWANCFCTPLASVYSCNNMFLASVGTTGGVSNFTNASACAFPSFTDYSTAKIASQYQGSAVTLTFGSSGAAMRYAVWIDFNDDGTFASGERVLDHLNAANDLSDVSASFNVPVGAAPGTHRMRVRAEAVSYTITSSCSQLAYGETEDYGFTVLKPASACSGIPAPGNTISSEGDAVCAGKMFTLSMQNSFALGGITYQWQVSTDGTTFTDIPNAVFATHVTSQTAVRWYRCLVTCTGSGQSAASAALQVGMQTGAGCYCTPPVSQYACTDAFVKNVKTTGGLTNFDNNSACSPTSFSYFNGVGASQYQGGKLNLSLSSSGAAMRYVVWIDFNDDGQFTSTEIVSQYWNNENALNDVSAQLNIPAAAPAGTHRMRVRAEHTAYFLNYDPCMALKYGETEDYEFTVVAKPSDACSSAPVPGYTLTSGSNPVCTGTNFTLSMQNSLTGTGYTYQWQSSADGVTYVSIAGATGTTHATSQSAATWYRCVVTCSNGNLSAASTPLQVTMNALGNCYCIPSTSATPCALYISNVTVTGAVTNFNNTTTCAPRSYADFSASVKAAQYQGQPVTISFSSANDLFRYGVWIDFNDNGVFESSEQVVKDNNTYNLLTGLSTSFTIPMTAPAGVHRMRVRGERNWYNIPDNACNTLNYGETEDYLMEVLETPVCSGTPSPGNTLFIGTGTVCSGELFTLTVENVPLQKNLSYQWQSSEDGISYTPIRNATDTLYTTSQTATTWYRCLVTCANGGASATTTAVKMLINNPTACYCTPTASQTSCTDGGAYISNVSTTGGITNFTNATACAPASYANYAATKSVSQYQGQTVNFSFAAVNGGPSYLVWIDFNDDGFFSTEERILMGYNSTVSYTLPLNALPGTHRMRVRADIPYYVQVTDPCNQLRNGETEDYSFTVVAAPACSGVPSPGNTLTTGANPVCAEKTFTLSVQNNPVITGLSYQWQSSSNGTSYTNLTGATAASYTTSQTAATYYRCVVTCAGSGLSGNSNPVHITMNSIANCYCTPAASADKCKVYISNVNTTGGVSNFTNTSACAATSYTNYMATRVASQYQGQTITFNLAATGGAMGYSAWIDFDDDGIFEPGEKMINNATAPATFRVPSTAKTGTHRMRVRAESYQFTNYNTNPYTYTYYASGVSDPCATLNYGETEDYGFTVLAQPACTGTPAPGNTVISGSSPVCAGTPFTLSLSNNLIQTGITYQWQSSVNGTAYYNIPGATAASLTTSQTAATYYRCVVTCAGSGLSGIATALLVNMNAATNCYCTPSSSYYSCYGHISNVSTTGGTTNFTNASACAGTSYTNYSASRVASQVQGGSINLNFTSVTYNYKYAVWIDWNDNGIFEPGEKILSDDNAADQLNVSASFTVPLLAPAGTHSMRVRGDINAPTDPCNLLQYGETEDYAFTVIASTACTGTPAPGNTLTSGANPVCWGTSFTLSLSSNLTQTGLQFQWQSSTDGTTFTNIANANFRTYTTSQTVATWYRCIVTCANSGLVGNSTTLLVNMNTAANCFCTPSVSYTPCGTRGYISNVTTTGAITNFANPTACAATSYTNYSATRVVSQYQGQDVNLNLATASGPLGFSIWVDYNDNGIFEASEHVLQDPNYGYLQNISTSFRIPAGAKPGTHRMRIRADYYYYNGWYSYYSYPYAPDDPCSKLDNGETEDYALTVVAPPACSGLPLAGTAAASSTSVCGSGTVDLSLSGGSTASTGMIYQWQMSRDGATFTNIKDATSKTYNSGPLSGVHTYAYRCVATCSNSGLSATSNTVTISAYETVAVTPANVSVCPGTSTTLTASPAGKVYSWSPGGQTTQSITVSIPGTYTVSVTQGSCVTTASATITALPVPVITSITATPATVCMNGTATLSVAATAGAPATYCTPASNCTFPDYISNVSFGTINRSSTCDNASNGYSFYTATNPIIMAGTAVPLSITTGGDREGVAVWIDFNQNGTFENSELVYHNYIGSNPTTYSSNIQIPATAVNGITRMRVRCQYLKDPSVDAGACYGVPNGETEDYQITIRGGVDPLNYSWSPATYLASLTGSTVSASGITANTTYTVKATSANGCFNTQTVPVTVLPLAQGSFSGNTICSGGAGQLTFTATSGTGPFTIVYNDGSSDITQNNVSSGVPFAVAASPAATATYSLVSVTGSNGCARTTGFTAGTATITVVPAPAITAQPQAVNVCSGSNATFTVAASGTGLSYQWQLSTNAGATWTNLANNATYSGALTNTLTLTNPAAGMTGYQYRVIISNSCITTSSAATLTVSAAPVITQQPQNVTVCAGGVAGFSVTATGTALSYQWQTSMDGIVWNNISGATAASLNLASVTDADNDKRFRVSVTAGGCTPSLISNSVLLTVPPAPSITAQPQPVSICAGSNASFTVAATGAGILYQWQMSTDGSTWTNIASATTTSLNLNAVSAAQNGNRYRVIVSGSCLPAVTSSAAILTVGTAFTVSSQPQNTTVCVGDHANFTVNATGTALAYQWQVSADGTSWNSIAGATGGSLTVPNVTANQHNYRYRVIVSGDCAAPYTTAAATLTVNQPAAFNTQPQPQTVCAGGTANFAVSATGTGLGYQWQWSADGAVWNNISGATSGTYSMSNLTAASNGYQYRVIVSSVCASAITSTAAALNVQAAPAVTAHPQPVAICSGSDASFTATATGTNIGYQWQSTSDGSAWNSISGATSASLAITNVAASQNGLQYRVLISGSCAPAVTSNAALLTVKPAAQISTHPQPVTACAGTNVSFTATASGSNIGYQWQSSADGTTWTNISGATSANLSINNIGGSENGMQYRVTVNSDCATALSSNAAALTVIMPAVIADQPQDAAVCEGGTAGFTVNVGGSGSSFQWQSGDGTTWSDISGATASALTLNNVTLSQNGTQYRVLVSSGSCATPVASTAGNLTVHALPVITTISASSPICTGQDLNFGFSLNNGSNVTANWDFGDGNTSTGEQPAHRYTTAGTYTVTLVVTTANGCTAAATKTVVVDPMPAASFTVNNPQQCITGNSFVFTNNSTGASTYNWDFGNGQTSNAQDPAHAYAAAGSYTVVLTTTSAGGCINVTQQTVSVLAMPTASFNVNNAAQCFAGNEFSFSNTSTGTNLSYNWNFGDGATAQTADAKHSYATAGRYTVTLTVNTATGCAQTFSRDVDLYPQPDPKFTVNSSSQCVNGNLFRFMNGSTIAAGTLSYEWSFGDGTTDNSVDPSHSYTTPGTYQVKLVVRTSNGCMDSVQQSVTVNAGPDASFSANKAVQCIMGNRFVFNLSSASGGDMYEWNLGDGTTATAASVSHSYTAAGTYVVKLKVTNSAGCTDSSSTTIEVVARPVAAFTVDIATQCLDGNRFRFTNSSSNSGSVVYNWIFGDGSVATAADATRQYAAPGTYEVKLVAVTPGGCASDTARTVVLIHPHPVVNAGADKQVSEGKQVIMDPRVTGDELTYQWSPTTYLVTRDTLLRPVFAPMEDTRYTLNVTGVGGCTATDDVMVRVMKRPLIPNAFSPNNDGVHDTWLIKYLDRYPDCTVEIYNRYGIKVFHSNGYATPWNGTFKGAALPVGTYYYVIDPKSGTEKLTGSITLLR